MDDPSSDSDSPAPSIVSLLGIKGSIRFRRHGASQKAHVVLRRVDDDSDDEDAGEDGAAKPKTTVRFSLFARKRIEVKPGKEILLALETADGVFGKDEAIVLEGDIEGAQAPPEEEDKTQVADEDMQVDMPPPPPPPVQVVIPPKMRRTWTKQAEQVSATADTSTSSTAIATTYATVETQTDPLPEATPAPPPPVKLDHGVQADPILPLTSSSVAQTDPILPPPTSEGACQTDGTSLSRVDDAAQIDIPPSPPRSDGAVRAVETEDSHSPPQVNMSDEITVETLVRPSPSSELSSSPLPLPVSSPLTEVTPSPLGSDNLLLEQAGPSRASSRPPPPSTTMTTSRPASSMSITMADPHTSGSGSHSPNATMVDESQKIGFAFPTRPKSTSPFEVPGLFADDTFSYSTSFNDGDPPFDSTPYEQASEPPRDSSPRSPPRDEPVIHKPKPWNPFVSGGHITEFLGSPRTSDNQSRSIPSTPQADEQVLHPPPSESIQIPTPVTQYSAAPTPVYHQEPIPIPQPRVTPIAIPDITSQSQLTPPSSATSNSNPPNMWAQPPPVPPPEVTGPRTMSSSNRTLPSSSKPSYTPTTPITAAPSVSMQTRSQTSKLATPASTAALPSRPSDAVIAASGSTGRKSQRVGPGPGPDLQTAYQQMQLHEQQQQTYTKVESANDPRLTFAATGSVSNPLGIRPAAQMLLPRALRSVVDVAAGAGAGVGVGGVGPTYVQGGGEKAGAGIGVQLKQQQKQVPQQQQQQQQQQPKQQQQKPPAGPKKRLVVGPGWNHNRLTNGHAPSAEPAPSTASASSTPAVQVKMESPTPVLRPATARVGASARRSGGASRDDNVDGNGGGEDDIPGLSGFVPYSSPSPPPSYSPPPSVPTGQGQGQGQGAPGAAAPSQVPSKVQGQSSQTQTQTQTKAQGKKKSSSRSSSVLYDKSLRSPTTKGLLAELSAVKQASALQLAQMACSSKQQQQQQQQRQSPAPVLSASASKANGHQVVVVPQQQEESPRSDAKGKKRALSNAGSDVPRKKEKAVDLEHASASSSSGAADGMDSSWPAHAPSATGRVHSGGEADAEGEGGGGGEGGSTEVLDIVLNSDGQMLAVICNDSSIRIWSNAQRQETARLALNAPVVAAAWMMDGKSLLTLARDGVVSQWTRDPLGQWQWTKLLDAGKEEAACLAHRRDRLAIGFPRLGVKLWIRNKAGNWLPQRSILRQNVTAIQFLDDGEALLGGTGDGVLGLPAASMQMVQRSAERDIESLRLPQVEDTKALDTSNRQTDSGRASLVNISITDKGKVVQVYQPQAESAASAFGASFGATGQMVLFGATDRQVLVWDADKGGVVCGLDCQTDEKVQSAVCFNRATAADTPYIVAGTKEGQLTWWDLPPISWTPGVVWPVIGDGYRVAVVADALVVDGGRVGGVVKYCLIRESRAIA
ncbi:hypothetical protein CONPUDRAFT_142052, partial [Coniophora puteana RWD-64-598 SS2]